MATAALIIGAIGAVGGFVQQRKIGKAQRKQNKVNNKVAAIARQRSIRQSIAQRRIAVAQAQSAGFNLGVSGGSAVAGATSGLIGDTASAIGASNLQFAGQQAVSNLSDRISGLQTLGAGFNALSSLAGTFAGGAGSLGSQNRAAISNLFG